MKQFWGVLGAAVLALTILAPAAWPTQIQYMSPRRLGAESELVVRGTVADVHSYWNPSRTKIFTKTRIDVDDSYKGSAGASIDVIQLGGVVGHVRMNVHGALAWRPGEEVLVFLERAGADAWQVAGFSQGKYRIERDDSGGMYVRNVPGDAAVIGAPARDGSPPAAGAGSMPLDAFINRVFDRGAEGGSR